MCEYLCHTAGIFFPAPRFAKQNEAASLPSTYGEVQKLLCHQSVFPCLPSIIEQQEEEEQLTLMYFRWTEGEYSRPAQYAVGEADDGVSSVSQSNTDGYKTTGKEIWDWADVRYTHSGTKTPWSWCRLLSIGSGVGPHRVRVTGFTDSKTAVMFLCCSAVLEEALGSFV